ncbi:MAG TPA: alpha/beta hydrolase [Myxococcales bacterium]|nr:alpha/beta hydrolase [Myxococcales bacterium]
MGRVRLAGLALEVRDEGRGPAVLLLHGFPTNHRLWDAVFPALRDAGLRCIAPDLAGYGLSDAPSAEPGMQLQAGLLAELLEVLALEAPLLVAHDVGSAAAQILVADRPRSVRGLVVSDGVYSGEWAMDQVESIQRWDPRNAARLAPVLARRLRSPRLRDETIRVWLEPYSGEEGGLRLIRAARALEPKETASRLSALAASAAPSLVLWGESDRYLSIDAVARPLAQLLRAELRILPGGHFLPAENPAAFAAEVLAFARALGLVA